MPRRADHLRFARRSLGGIQRGSLTKMMRDSSCGAGKKEPFGFAIGIFENRCGFPRSEMTS
jgi:hypothetical protein